MRALFLIAALMLAHPVHGGPWLREEGAVFLSFGTAIDALGRRSGSVYAEYGLRPKLTLGAKVDVDMTGGRVGDGSAYIFARKPIPTGERNFKIALDLGIGGTIEEHPAPLLRAGLSFGRGLTVRDRAGWIAVDGALEWVQGEAAMTVKLDSTIGVTLSDNFKVMFQTFYSQFGTEAATTFAPSLLWQPNSKKNKSYQFGLESKDGVLGIRLGVWHSF